MLAAGRHRGPLTMGESREPERGRLCVLFHESEILGAGVSIVRALGELRSRGWTSSGWFPGPGPLRDEAAAVLATQGAHEKPIAFSARGWRREPGLSRRLWRTPAYLRALDRWLATDAPDVVHANSLLMLPEATIARRRGFPVVVQVHELPPVGPKRDLTLRWAGAVADVLVGVSEPVTRMLLEGAGDTPVVTIRNGAPAAIPTRRSGGAFVVGTIGHISRTKGTDVFLQAARLALAARPELRFEHVGPGRLWGDDEFDAQVEALAAAPELQGALRMRGQRPTAAMLAQWSMFVLASRQDAFPLSTLEAMAAGVPVIACAVGGIPEQIEHLETGILVPPEDPSALSAWIVRLHDDDELRARLATRAREHVQESFPLSTQAEALDRAYAEAIERRRRRGRGLPGGNAEVAYPEPMADPSRERVERHNRAQIAYFERAGKHAMRPTDSHYVQRQVDRLVDFGDLVPGELVLDVGCGMGRYTFALAERGLIVEGLDLSETLLERFRQHDAGRFEIPLRCGDVLDPPEELRGRFDAVVGFFTLHHLHDLAGCLRSMRSLCKTGGRIVFLEPNPVNATYYLQMLLVPGMSWSGDKGILNMTERTMSEAMRSAGFGKFSLERFGFFPPFVVNQPWGPPVEDGLERFPPWRRFLPFQLFRGDVARQG